MRNIASNILGFVMPVIMIGCQNLKSGQDDTGRQPEPATIRLHQSDSAARVKNIILLIGDGMGITQITAGLIAKKDALNIARCAITGLSITNSSDNLITDSAAGATALSTGKKTYNGAIGVDTDKKPMKTILEIAEEQGLSTGLVATSSITHATPASFIAHQPDRTMEEEIAADFLKTDIDVFIGGGRKFFEQRHDGRNLTEELKNKGYKVCYKMDDIVSAENGKLAGFVADENPKKISEGRGDMLSAASLTAIKLLVKNEKGFFLMIEGSQIDWGGHSNESDYIIEEMLDFDDAIGKALDFAEKDGETLVIITSDHETGGYAITGGDWESGKVKGKFVSGDHTAAMVPVFAFGPGAKAFSGMYHNSDIFWKMTDALNLH